MSEIKVDTLSTVSGSGNITLSNNVASLTSAGAISGTNLTASGTLTSTGLITASAGLAVGGTGTANTLDDYEEGTWTPRLQDLNGNEASAYTSGYPVGTYTKVGRHVWVNFSIRITNKGSMTGNYVHVAGLPFNRDATGEGRGTGTIDYYSGLASSRSYLALDCTSTTSVMWLVGGSNSTSTSYVSVGNLNNTCMFKGGAHYITAS